MNLTNRQTTESYVSAKLDSSSLPSPKGSSFCWSLAAILKTLGKEISRVDVRGYSLSAFSIWAHPEQDIKLWQEPFAHLFFSQLLDALGVHGELLCLPDDTDDHLGYFLSHWASRVRTYLLEGIPVGVMEVWPESLWGIVTDWHPEQRVLKGYMPGRRGKITNRCWPKSLLLIGKKPVKPGSQPCLAETLRNVSRLGSNGLQRNDWASGLDAYLIWKDKAEEAFDYLVEEHSRLARNLAQARRHAASFLSRHADLGMQGTDRMMHSLARRYKRISEHLTEAAQAQRKLPFIRSLTYAIAEEEKALAMVDELLVRLD